MTLFLSLKRSDDNLLTLQRKKLQRQILYLRTELEETTFIFSGNFLKIGDLFREIFPNFGIFSGNFLKF